MVTVINCPESPLELSPRHLHFLIKDKLNKWELWLAFCWGWFYWIILQGLGLGLALKTWWCPERLGNNTWGHHPCNLQKNVGFCGDVWSKVGLRALFPGFSEVSQLPDVLKNPGCCFPLGRFIPIQFIFIRIPETPGVSQPCKPQVRTFGILCGSGEATEPFPHRGEALQNGKSPKNTRILSSPFLGSSCFFWTLGIIPVFLSEVSQGFCWSWHGAELLPDSWVLGKLKMCPPALLPKVGKHPKISAGAGSCKVFQGNRLSAAPKPQAG